MTPSTAELADTVRAGFMAYETEKEGFEPSFDAKQGNIRPGFEHEGSVPTETLDLALAEKVRAILERETAQ